MVIVIHKDYCSKCKRKDVPLCKYSRGRGEKYQYYRCRECNNRKQSAYLKTTAGLEAASRSRDATNKKFPEKFKARQQVAYALRKGEISKPAVCSMCNEEGRIEGHHMDYSKPLEVVWLCPSCHADYDKVS